MTGERKKPHLASYADWNHFADVDAPQERFVALVRDALPDCEASDDEIDAVRDDVQWLFGKAVGQYNWSQFQTPRRALSRRINQLEQGLATVAEILASSGHRRTKEDSDVLSFISKSGLSSAHLPATINQEIAACRDGVEAMLSRTRDARKQLESLNGEGSPPLFWYEPVVDASILLATTLHVSLTTAGNRMKNQHETPFTWLTLRLEDFLPDAMKSAGLAACAKRIERSATWQKARGSGHVP